MELEEPLTSYGMTGVSKVVSKALGRVLEVMRLHSSSPTGILCSLEGAPTRFNQPLQPRLPDEDGLGLTGYVHLSLVLHFPFSHLTAYSPNGSRRLLLVENVRLFSLVSALSHERKQRVGECQVRLPSLLAPSLLVHCPSRFG